MEPWRGSKEQGLGAGRKAEYSTGSVLPLGAAITSLHYRAGESDTILMG